MIRNLVREVYRRALPLLFARRQFKLLLKSSLGDIDLRMLALASATDYFSSFVQAIPIEAPFGRSMLVVAPHQDDEAIGCGGALALQVRAGAGASILLLQDGADEAAAAGYEPAAMTALRNEESRRAAAVIGVDPPVFLDHRSLAAVIPKAAEQVRALVAERAADAVFVPFVLDAHPDHRTANYIVAEALRGVARPVRVLQYEVWGFCIPNVIVKIDDIIDAKRAMLDCFRSANAAVDYTNSTIGVNMFHSRMLGSGACRYAERFFELPREEYVELVDRVRAAEPVRGPSKPSAQSASTNDR